MFASFARSEMVTLLSKRQTTSAALNLLTVALIFFPKLRCFEVRPKGLLHSISVSSNMSLIWADGPEYILSFFFYLSSLPPPHSVLLLLQCWAIITHDVKGRKTTRNQPWLENDTCGAAQAVQPQNKSLRHCENDGWWKKKKKEFWLFILWILSNWLDFSLPASRHKT